MPNQKDKKEAFSIGDYEYELISAKDILRDLGYKVSEGGELPTATKEHPGKSGREENLLDKINFAIARFGTGRGIRKGRTHLEPIDERSLFAEPHSPVVREMGFILVRKEGSREIQGMVNFIPGKIGKIDRHVVNPELRRKGVGTNLESLAIKILHEKHDCRQIKTHAESREGIEFHKGLGYEERDGGDLYLNEAKMKEIITALDEKLELSAGEGRQRELMNEMEEPQGPGIDRR